MRYHADITAGSLKVAESRVVADLLLRGVDAQGWKDAVVTQNLLQTRNPATAIRLGRLIRKRLELMDADLWRLIRDGSAVVATHAVLAAAVKHSPLLGDFLAGRSGSIPNLCQGADRSTLERPPRQLPGP